VSSEVPFCHHDISSSHHFAEFKLHSHRLCRSTGLGITFFLLLLGRSVITPLWDVPPPTSTAAAGGIHPGTALISWSRLTRAMLLRPFRFILPVIAIAALQWGLGATGKLSQSNAVGMDEPYWGLIGSFSGLATLIFDLVSFPHRSM
jgi:hypothetical protein